MNSLEGVVRKSRFTGEQHPPVKNVMLKKN